MDKLQNTETPLNKARRTLAHLEEQAAGFGSLNIPVHLRIELEDKREEVARLKARLPLDQTIEREYLEQVVRIYENWLAEYTQSSAALTMDKQEQRRHSNLYALMSKRYPPTDKDSQHFTGAEEKGEKPIQAPVLEQVAAMQVGAILGAPGAGKTTTLRRLALHYALIALGWEPNPGNDLHAGKIPLLIPLGGYNGEDLLTYISQFLLHRTSSDNHVHSVGLAERLVTYLETGRLLIMFDALNEVAEEFRSQVFSTVSNFATTYCSPKARNSNSFFLSCREADYVKGFAELPRLVLEPLDDERISTFLKNYFQADPEAQVAIEDQLKANNGQLLELVRNPYLLKVVVELYQVEGKLPQTRGELFQEFGNYLVGWGLKREKSSKLLQELLPEEVVTGLTLDNLVPVKQKLTVERLTGLVALVLGRLAYSMLSDQSRGTEANLEWAINKLPEKVHYTFPYRTRLKIQQHQLELESTEALELAQRGGLINIIEYPGKTELTRIRYSHQLLQEYFAAAYLNSAEVTKEEWQQASYSYDFDEVFPLLTDLSHDPLVIVKEVWEIDFGLACRCASLLPTERLTPEFHEWLIKVLIAKLELDFQPDFDKVIKGLVSIKAVKALCGVVLNHPNKYVRISAIWALKDLGAKEAIPDIVPLLKDQDENIRGRVVEALSKLGAKEAIPDIVPLLKDSDEVVRCSAVDALKELGAKEAIPALVPLLKDSDEVVRRSAVDALKELGAKEAIPALVPLLKDSDKAVRRRAVEALDSLEDKEAIPALVAFLKDSDELVRHRAVEALDSLEDKEAIPALVAFLKDSDNAVRRRAIEALIKLRAKEAIPAIVALLKDQDNGVRSSAVVMLKTLGNSIELIDMLKPLLNHPIKDVKEIIYSLREELKQKLRLPKDY